MLMTCRFSDIQMVRLVAGQEKTEILVHENVLFEASPVFKAAFTSKFKESSERAIYLPDDDATLMDILIRSLYAPESRPNGIDTIMQSLRVYVLADKYDIVKVKNKICEDVYLLLFYPPDLSACGIPMSTVQFVYENTTSTAPMRRLLVDWFVYTVKASWFSEEVGRRWLLALPEFAADACAVLVKDFDREAKDCCSKEKTSRYMEEEPVEDKSQIK